MIIQLLMLGGAAAVVWHKNNSSSRASSQAAKRSLQKQPRRSTSTDVRHMLREIRRTVKAEGRQQLQVDIDPKQLEAIEKKRQKNRQELLLSIAAAGTVLLGSFSPLFAAAGTVAVLYLAKELFFLIRKDFQRGHYLSVYLVGLAMLLGMIATGHLLLAACTGVMSSFFAGLINRLEDSSEQQLISVFSGHPEHVWLLRDGMEIQVDFHSLQAGDRLVVNAGEVIPADGRIESGEGQIDQHLLTGESQPVEKAAGDTVFASTLLLSGRLTIAVSSAGNDTMAAKIGNILNQTRSYKDNLIIRGRKVADRLLPVEMGLSAITLPLLGPNAAIAVLWANLGGNMAPLGSLSVLTYLQILSRHNILVKDGRVFELLRQVDTVVFDKTGTLTLEQPVVGQIYVLGQHDAAAVLRWAAAAERRQPHPIAKAILAKAEAEEGLSLPELDEASYVVGYGIKVMAEGRFICVGSARFLEREGIALPDEAMRIQQQAEDASCSLIYVAVDNQLVGILEMQPAIRPEAAAAIQHLQRRGIQVCIISGDHERPTRSLAEHLGIDHFFAEVLPESKADHVERLKKEGRFVCFVGDGINDAIALKAAHISISLKGASTAATDTAQIILMDGTLNHLEPLFQFADEFEETMRRNLALSVVPGSLTIGGVYLLHLSIAMSMGIFYASFFAGLGNVIWPLIKHQEEQPDME